MTARLAVVLIGAVMTALVLGGCRADDRGQSSAQSSTVPVGGAADPLANVEAVVGAVERDLDADAGVADR